MRTTHIKYISATGINTNRVIIASKQKAPWEQLGFDKDAANLINNEIKNDVQPITLSAGGARHFIFTVDKEASSTAAALENGDVMAAK